MPSLELKHSYVKNALNHFQKLYPGMIGGEASLVFNHISLSYRVLLYHYRKAAADPQVWATAKRKYKKSNKEGLFQVEDVMCRIEFEEDEKEIVNGETQTSTALVPYVERQAPAAYLELQDQAPLLDIFQVGWSWHINQ